MGKAIILVIKQARDTNSLITIYSNTPPDGESYSTSEKYETKEKLMGQSMYAPTEAKSKKGNYESPQYQIP